MRITALSSYHDRIYGLDLGPFGLNRANRLYGIQLGILNQIYFGFGLQGGIISNVAKISFTGLQVSAVNRIRTRLNPSCSPQKSDSKFLQIGLFNYLFFNSKCHDYGGQFGLFNSGSFTGIQVGGFNSSRNTQIQLGFFNATTDQKEPRLRLQNSYQFGVFNLAFDQFSGSQIGLLNASKQFHGLQVGFINVTKQFYGVQVGLLNIRTGSSNSFPQTIPFQAVPLLNWSFG